jgi:crossover junction endodeoxyribonuclease RusA
MSKFPKSPFAENRGARRGGKNWAAGSSKPKKKPSRPRPDPKPIDDITDLPAGQRVIVPFPPVELSPNWRGHYQPRARAAKVYRNACWALALQAKLKVPDYAQDGRKIRIRIDFFPPSRASRDDDNVPASFKAGRDGIADAMKCDDARFKTENVLRDEPRSCVVFTILEGKPE